MGTGDAEVGLGTLPVFVVSIRLTITFDPLTGPTCVILKAEDGGTMFPWITGLCVVRSPVFPVIVVVVVVVCGCF